ncbi:ATP-binding cassette domain-containing protein [Enterococcus rivorum]|uniref:ATP-binding cassette domain-containing protein n=1 Tax=Enterococcus rivorum TaxID=762845 RepID=UPI0036321803
MVLDICGLSKSFGKVKVLKNINFRIDTPRLIALVAPNGSGKSTLMNLICNLETIDEGEITVWISIKGIRNL